MKADNALPAIAAIGAGIAAHRVWRSNREVREIASEAHRHEVYNRELEAFSRGREQIAQRTETTAVVVQAGTKFAKFSHHAIAAIPFTILEAIPVTRYPTLVVHRTHDVIADGAYFAAGRAARVLSTWVTQSLSAKIELAANNERPVVVERPLAIERPVAIEHSVAAERPIVIDEVVFQEFPGGV